MKYCTAHLHSDIFMKTFVTVVLQGAVYVRNIPARGDWRVHNLSQTDTCASPYIVNRAPIKSYGQIMTLKKKFVPSAEAPELRSIDLEASPDLNRLTRGF